MKKVNREPIIIYHNNRCSKSREACSILEKQKKTFVTIEYLKTPLSQSKIKELLKMLGMKAEEVVRKSETSYKENYAGKKITEAQWVKILAENPILIERPIVVNNGKAIVARPPEKVLEILNT